MACGNGDQSKSLRMTLDNAWNKMLQMQSMTNNVRTHTHPAPVALARLLQTCAPPELALRDIHMMHLNEGGEFPRTQLTPYRGQTQQGVALNSENVHISRCTQQPANVISICAHLVSLLRIQLEVLNDIACNIMVAVHCCIMQHGAAILILVMYLCPKSGSQESDHLQLSTLCSTV